MDAETPPANGQVPNEIRAQELFGLLFSLGFFTPLSKGATLSRLSDLRVSKEGADFLGTLFESLHEAGDSIFELGLVGGDSLTGKVLLEIVVEGLLAAGISRPPLLSPEGFLASFLEAFPPPVDPGPTNFQFIGSTLLYTTFLQHLDRPTAYLFLGLRIQGPCISFFHAME